MPENEIADPFVWVEHNVTGGGTWIPDDPDVLEAHEARGWFRAVPKPGSETTRPDRGDVPAGEWVEMVHPETGGTQLVPNGDGVIEAQRELGWVLTAEHEAEQEKQTKKRSKAADTKEEKG